MPAIVVGVIIFEYEEQYAWVNWGGSNSNVEDVTLLLRKGVQKQNQNWILGFESIKLEFVLRF